MSAPVGWAFDIGGGVAYACDECRTRAEALPHDPDLDFDFWPFDPATANGTERCEDCGRPLVDTITA